MSAFNPLMPLVALARKDLVLYLNDKRALMLHLLMPVVLAAFFGSLFGGGSQSQTGRIDVGLVVQDSAESSRKIVAGLKADPTLRITELDDAAAQQQVRAGKLPVAVVIPAGFGTAADSALFGGPQRARPELPLYYDPSQSAVLAMVKGLLTQQVMQATSAAMMGAGGAATTARQIEALRDSARTDTQAAQLGAFLASLKTYQDQRAATAGAGGKQGSDGSEGSGGSEAAGSGAAVGMAMPYTTREQALSSGPRYNGYAHSFAGMGVQFILFMGIEMGVAMLLARRLGIWNRLLAAPVSLATVVTARALSATVIALGLMCALFACAALMFGVRVDSLAGFLGVALGFALVTATFGLLIAAFGKTPEAARGIAVFATLIMVVLGGAWVPAFIFPAWMQTATLAIPTRWAIDGFDAVTWRGLGLAGALPSIAVLFGFAALFGALAIYRFSRDQR